MDNLRITLCISAFLIGVFPDDRQEVTFTNLPCDVESSVNRFEAVDYEESKYKQCGPAGFYWILPCAPGTVFRPAHQACVPRDSLAALQTNPYPHAEVHSAQPYYPSKGEEAYPYYPPNEQLLYPPSADQYIENPIQTQNVSDQLPEHGFISPYYPQYPAPIQINSVPYYSNNHEPLKSGSLPPLVLIPSEDPYYSQAENPEPIYAQPIDTAETAWNLPTPGVRPEADSVMPPNYMIPVNPGTWDEIPNVPETLGYPPPRNNPEIIRQPQTSQLNAISLPDSIVIQTDTNLTKGLPWYVTGEEAGNGPPRQPYYPYPTTGAKAPQVLDRDNKLPHDLLPIIRLPNGQFGLELPRNTQENQEKEEPNSQDNPLYIPILPPPQALIQEPPEGYHPPPDPPQPPRTPNDLQSSMGGVTGPPPQPQPPREPQTQVKLYRNCRDKEECPFEEGGMEIYCYHQTDSHKYFQCGPHHEMAGIWVSRQCPAGLAWVGDRCDTPGRVRNDRTGAAINQSAVSSVTHQPPPLPAPLPVRQPQPVYVPPPPPAVLPSPLPMEPQLPQYVPHATARPLPTPPQSQGWFVGSQPPPLSINKPKPISPFKPPPYQKIHYPAPPPIVGRPLPAGLNPPPFPKVPFPGNSRPIFPPRPSVQNFQQSILPTLPLGISQKFGVKPSNGASYPPYYPGYGFIRPGQTLHDPSERTKTSQPLPFLAAWPYVPWLRDSSAKVKELVSVVPKEHGKCSLLAVPRAQLWAAPDGNQNTFFMCVPPSGTSWNPKEPTEGRWVRMKCPRGSYFDPKGSVCSKWRPVEVSSISKRKT